MTTLPPPVATYDTSGPAQRPTRRLSGHSVQFGGLLGLTGLLYIVGLGASGWANQFYAAAAQAGSKSWTAMLFGSLDASNYITVDKPPASLWVMDLSMRIFGVNSWSLLVPQALEGVASVALIYLAVKRVGGHWAGMLAGAALATTPIATLMFRFDNPDAMLVLLMTAAVYATVRAVEAGSARWLMLTGSLLGFAFLTKMLQGVIIVPALGLTYLVAARNPLRTRLIHLAAATGALIVSAGWYIALVELWPAGSRPYIGGSTNNSILELTFGYNGLGRLTGSDNNGTPGGNGGGGFSSGSTGLGRLFGSDMGSQISWLLPAALVGLAGLGWVTRRAARTDALRASAIAWGGWLLLTGAVFSFASGIIHPYYTVALAPAIAGLVGLGTVALWRDRRNGVSLGLLVAMVAAAAGWSWELLGRADWHPELRWIVLVSGLAAIVALLLRQRAVVVAPLIALTMLAAPTAYSLQTAATPHTGALPTAGPSATGGFGGGRGPGGGGFPGGGFPGGGQPPTAGQAPAGGQAPTGGFPGGGQMPTGMGGGPGGGGGAGGLGGATSVDSALVTALQSGDYTWSAATTSANQAASLELASGTSVMAIGGFNGTDNATTLAAFQQLVREGKIHYYIGGGNQGFIGSTAANTSVAYQIQQWVSANYTATTLGGTTVYDMTS